MRPDLDDYEELNQDDAGAPRGRAISWLVLGVAVVGFGALAYYAYQSGSQSAADGQMVVVEAETGAIKEVPADAGGEQFPHKDKTIYDALSPYRTDEGSVEKLLPEPEEPVIPEPAVNAAEPEKKAESTTTTFVNDGVNEKSKAEVDDTVRSTPAPVAAPLESVTVAEAPVATKTITMPEKKPEPVKVEAAKVEPKTETITPLKKPEPVKEAAKPVVVAKPVVTPAASGDYKIQLAALGSDSEARQTWSKITAKHGDIVKGSPIVVKAEVNGKTYYRLRASGFASADAAKRACATLSSRGQGCMPAGK